MLRIHSVIYTKYIFKDTDMNGLKLYIIERREKKIHVIHQKRI